jgi:hypothetical protein
MWSLMRDRNNGQLLTITHKYDVFSLFFMARHRKESTYDDETLENMKRYYRIDNHDELLKYIKKNRLVGKNEGEELPHSKNT